MQQAHVEDSLDPRRIPTTTLIGWRQYVDAEPAALNLIDHGRYEALAPDEQAAYDDCRMAYHSELVTIETSAVKNIVRQGKILTLVNQRECGARRSMIVSGPWATGKTTTIKLLGRLHERDVRRKYPNQERIPVVYITTPPKGSPRKLAAEFAHFLGISYKPRANVADIADSVCHVLTEMRTDLVIVDEIHNLNLATSAGEDMSDHLKYFTEHMPATFIYAGINVDRSGLFTGIRGQQISARSVLMRTGSFPNNDEWEALVAGLEAALRLYRHKHGTLIKNSKYLHQRTSGSISGLSYLVRTAAISAILTRDEAITRDLLHSIPIDHASETLTTTASGTRAKP
ncbi:TniB family NTP-binding protein [Segniliparus rugosus]|uniref:ATP/GTP-binding protein n=1 Tax=Segniliparus rugosus (strain ATCC BAA-974 / DSM 45345 / CCUG 50838 / CIP 108380 / JCM 13579 / CDC 945) TaxID=679197 RepID=E5XPA8_SEGRC|nr:TniB family NTP-binding protein [Segniliparus rugosus]EFV13817.1 hypothetical protein HMPREF9336_01330 [Segniliparus rugosus ATCC BAA-974]